MSKKKTILVVALAISLFAIAVGGTLAWFTDNDEVTNTFTVGEIDIYQHEHERDENNQIQQFTQDQVLLPVVNVTNVAEDENYVEKLVSVENIGKNEAYVRTFIAVPAVIKDIICLDTAADNAGTKWVQDTITWPNATVDGIEYAIISFTYTDELVKGDITDYVLEGVYMDAKVDLQDNAGVKQFCIEDANGNYTFYDYDITKNVNVLVATQGVQARGFANAEAAMTSAFPNHPWAQ
jgi:predicted ribosomally synthesized peptide with SipW-like signal peptide